MKKGDFREKSLFQEINKDYCLTTLQSETQWRKVSGLDHGTPP